MDRLRIRTRYVDVWAPKGRSRLGAHHSNGTTVLSLRWLLVRLWWPPKVKRTSSG